ncbi:MAG: antibiotic biosynthesis monooxygenase [Myxococcales bacterium]|nr:antibiotic biosynthesis monooxygenase [Myxococcales bacterium]
MAVTVTVRAKLKDPKNAQKQHDELTRGTKEMAKQAGDISHKVFIGVQDPRAFLGIDEWQSAEQFQKFFSDPKIQQVFGQLFDGQPEVTVWENNGWFQW